ncbi:toluene-4-monooxygenase system B family protein [Aeromonas sp. 602293]|uniref:toluene-4-monooxygenase system B family protein n=1 Tax=Aeromonas sp. 602293 TaxID=2712041 RepID=UPI003B9E0605
MAPPSLFRVDGRSTLDQRGGAVAPHAVGAQGVAVDAEQLALARGGQLLEGLVRVADARHLDVGWANLVAGDFQHRLTAAHMAG